MKKVIGIEIDMGDTSEVSDIWVDAGAILVDPFHVQSEADPIPIVIFR